MRVIYVFEMLIIRYIVLMVESFLWLQRTVQYQAWQGSGLGQLLVAIPILLGGAMQLGRNT